METESEEGEVQGKQKQQQIEQVQTGRGYSQESEQSQKDAAAITEKEKNSLSSSKTAPDAWAATITSERHEAAAVNEKDCYDRDEDMKKETDPEQQQQQPQQQQQQQTPPQEDAAGAVPPWETSLVLLGEDLMKYVQRNNYIQSSGAVGVDCAGILEILLQNKHEIGTDMYKSEDEATRNRLFSDMKQALYDQGVKSVFHEWDKKKKMLRIRCSCYRQPDKCKFQFPVYWNDDEQHWYIKRGPGVRFHTCSRRNIPEERQQRIGPVSDCEPEMITKTPLVNDQHSVGGEGDNFEQQPLEGRDRQPQEQDPQGEQQRQRENLQKEDRSQEEQNPKQSNLHQTHSRDNSEEEGVLFQRPTVIVSKASTTTAAGAKPLKREAPDPSFHWHEASILECFQLAVDSHDDPMIDNGDGTTMSSNKWCWNSADCSNDISKSEDDEVRSSKRRKSQQQRDAIRASMSELAGWEPIELKLPP